MIDNFNSDVFLNKIQFLDKKDKTYMLKLYKKYEFNNNKFKDEKQMIEYENKIYTIDGNTLSDKLRIQLELYKIIQSLCKDGIGEDERKDISSKLDEISSTLDSIVPNNDNSIIINKIKKDVTYMQLKLGLSTKFFKATSDLFEDNYNNIIVDDLENKKVHK